MPASTSSKRTNIWLHIVMLLMLLVLIQAAATQITARRLGYHPRLGKPVIGRVYAPWMWLVWNAKWHNVKPDFFNRVYLVSVGATAGAFALYVVTLTLWGRRHQPAADLHGSAHWASEDEIRQTGLLPAKDKTGEGVYVGGWKDAKGRQHYLRHNGPEHVMVFAPTRSGKGVGLVLPTLLSWMHSAVILDIKGENWSLTSGWRKQHAGNRVLKFDPVATDGSSVKFNPLDEIRLETAYAVADVQNIVSMVVDPDGKGLNDHWAKTGHALLVGAVLHCLSKAKASGETATLKGVADLLSDPTREITDVFKEMLESEHASGTVREVVAACARDMLNKADNERSGVLSTAMSFLTLYRDPIVADNTSKSEFTIKSLMNLEQPVSLYLVVPPSDKDRLKPLVRLLINQIVRKLTEEMSFKDGTSVQHYKHRLLLMIDEFPSLGRLDIFQEALAFVAGYGLKAYLITQDLSQLYAAYGKDESILSNCHVRIAYAPNKIETAELLSKMAGTTTIVKQSVSRSGKRYGVALDNVSMSHQEVQRPLLTPDECMRLPGPKKNAQGQITEAGDMLIFTAGFPAIYGKQILYFKDEVFAARAKVEAPRVSERVSDDEIKVLKAAEATARKAAEARVQRPAEAQTSTAPDDETQASLDTGAASPTKPDVDVDTPQAPEEAAAGV